MTLLLLLFLTPLLCSVNHILYTINLHRNYSKAYLYIGEILIIKTGFAKVKFGPSSV